MNYPGGRSYKPRQQVSTTINYANRGMSFETLVEWMNETYEQKQMAAIEKIPTAVKVLRSEGSRIKDGVYVKHGTVDYTGTYQGRAIWFDAKSTDSLTSFPLNNLHSEQMERLTVHYRNQAICFLLVQFDKLRRVFLLPYEVLDLYWSNRKAGARGTNSIPLAIFETHAFEIFKSKIGPLDYLEGVHAYINHSLPKE